MHKNVGILNGLGKLTAEEIKAVERVFDSELLFPELREMTQSNYEQFDVVMIDVFQWFDSSPILLDLLGGCLVIIIDNWPGNECVSRSLPQDAKYLLRPITEERLRMAID